MPSEDLSEERQKQILEAAITEFARHGFHATRMEDIARASGLSKGAVYLYYRSKDAIIAALLRTLFAWELRGARAVVEGAGSAAERLLALTHMFADELDRMVVAMPILLEFYAVAFRQSSVREHLGQMYEEFRAPLAQLIQEGIEHGEFRQVEPDAVGLAWIALLEGLTLLWVVNPRGIAWREQADAAVRLLLDGLLAQPKASAQTPTGAAR
ncbi:MAG TPA: TetR/AcrR family transcriptional regulator [Ktedonobacterales bacterium]|nr:TetR/AcrR family transcriptional regulator [Ktedonobacterales bacterium]